MAPPSMGASMFGPSSLIPTGPDDVVPLEYTAADMSLSTLYLHALHQQRVIHTNINTCIIYLCALLLYDRFAEEVIDYDKCSINIRQVPL